MRFKKFLAVGLAAATMAVGAEIIAPAVASAATFDYTCGGIDNDSADTGYTPAKSSKEILEQVVAALTGSSTLPLSVNATTNAPSKIRPGAAPFNAAFDFTVSLPSKLLDAAKGLGIASVDVLNASFSVAVGGGASGSITGGFASKTIPLSGATTISQSMSGTVTPKSGGGAITYSPGETRLTLVLNLTTPIKLKQLTVTCGSNKRLFTTAVQEPGAPNINDTLLNINGRVGVNFLPVLSNGTVVPDGDKPIIPSTLRVTDSAGLGYGVRNGVVILGAPQRNADTTYDVGLEVCAAGGLSVPVPGANEVQSMKWGQTNYNGQPLNAHPLGFKLSFRGAKTAFIPTSFNPIFNTPTDINSPLEIIGFSEFRAPSAATIQTALQAVSTIGAGNVQVTGGTNGAPYTFTFTGALGNQPIEDKITIEDGDWTTFLPADTLTKLSALLNPPAVPGAPVTTTTTPLTAEQIDALLPTIGFDQWLDKRVKLALANLPVNEILGQVGALLPKPPVFDYETGPHGVTPIPTFDRGAVCSPFTVSLKVPKVTVLGSRVIRKCAVERVKVGKKTVRKTVCRRYRQELRPVASTKLVSQKRTVTVKGRKKTVTVKVRVPTTVNKWITVGPA